MKKRKESPIEDSEQYKKIILIIKSFNKHMAPLID